MNNENVNSIDLKELFIVLHKNLLFIILITFMLTIGLGLYTKYFISEKFESKTLINVTKVVDDENTNNSSDIFRYGTELAKRYSIIAKSNKVITMVQDDLKTNHNLDIEEATLKNSFEVVSVNETDILRITVNYIDYQMAQIIADSVTKASMTVYENTYVDAKVTNIDEADFNINPVSPNINLNLVIGFVLGLMISTGIVMVKEFMNRKIKTEKDIEQFLNIPYFGSIPDIKKYKNA